MKRKFKLIKTYPGSPKLGREIEVNEKVAYFHFNINEGGCVSLETKALLAGAYSEFWQEIIKKTFDIETIQHVNGTKYSLQSTGKFAVSNICSFNQYSAEHLLQNDRYRIVQVKRLSDNVSFQEGQSIEVGKLGDGFKIVGFKLKDNKLHVGVSSTSRVYVIDGVSLEVIRHKEIEKFQVIEYTNRGGSEWTLKLSSSGIWYSENQQYTPDYVESQFRRGNWIVKTIKRLSDGETISLGEPISFDGRKSEKIIKIYRDGRLQVDLNGKCYQFEDLQRNHKVLFITEDGYPVAKGDTVFYLNLKKQAIFKLKNVKENVGIGQGVFVFKTEAGMREFIDNRRKQFLDKFAKLFEINFFNSI